jgi:uncharacterized membrane protein YfcA
MFFSVFIITLLGCTLGCLSSMFWLWLLSYNVMIALYAFPIAFLVALATNYRNNKKDEENESL